MCSEKTNPPGEASETRFADLLEAGLESTRPWRAEELAAAWDYHLSAPIEFELGAMSAHRARALRDLAMAQGLTVSSVRALMQHPVPPIELLTMIARFAKACLKAKDSPVLREVAGVLYYLAIAVAVTRLGTLVTRLRRADLMRGLDWALARPWVDQSSKATLEQARASVTKETGGGV